MPEIISMTLIGTYRSTERCGLCKEAQEQNGSCTWEDCQFYLQGGKPRDGSSEGSLENPECACGHLDDKAGLDAIQVFEDAVKKWVIDGIGSYASIGQARRELLNFFNDRCQLEGAPYAHMPSVMEVAHV